MAAPVYTSVLTSLAADAFYRAEDVGAFNANSDAGSFGAYCTFIYRATAQVPGGAPTRQFLWGNSSDAVFSGWSLEIVDVAGEATLQAKVGNGAAYITAQEPLTGPYVVATGQGPAAGIFGRLIMASMWCDNANLILAINGTICAYTPFTPATGRVPSLLPATLGAGGAAVPAVAATRCSIASAGYSIFPGLNILLNVTGFLNGSFDAARTNGSSGYMSQNAGIDWTHRYDVGLSSKGLQGTVFKTAYPATLTAPANYVVNGLPPKGPQTLVDQGNRGAANMTQPPIVPVNLIRGGASTVAPDVFQHKGADWANAGTFFFTP